MTDRFSTYIRALVDAALEGPGRTSTDFRRAVQSRAADLPPAVAAYVEKVALHAYKVTDADIDVLTRAGYSEDAIFEITVNAAVAAGLARFERGRAVLMEEGTS